MQRGILIPGHDHKTRNQTWRAPDVLSAAGVADAPDDHTERPGYELVAGPYAGRWFMARPLDGKAPLR